MPSRKHIAEQVIKVAQLGHTQGGLEGFIGIMHLAGLLDDDGVRVARRLISVLPDCDGEDRPTPRKLLLKIAKVKREAY